MLYDCRNQPRVIHAETGDPKAWVGHRHRLPGCPRRPPAFGSSRPRLRRCMGALAPGLPGRPLPLRAVALSPPTSITSWPKTRARPTAKPNPATIAMLATRHGRAATKAAWPEGRAVQTETLFGFLMAATIGPADSSSCRIAGRPCLAFVQQRFARIPRFFGCSSKSNPRPGNDPRNSPSLGGNSKRATIDLGERRGTY